MAKKTTNKVSVRAFEKVVKEVENKETTFEWNGLEITVKRTISFQDILNFVNSVAESCFDSTTGKYMPEVKLFMIKLFTLSYYTNIAMPQNLEEKYRFVYHTDIFEAVKECIDKRQFCELCDAIEEKLDYMASSRIGEIEKQIIGLSDVIEDIEKKISDLFVGINSDDITKLVGAMTNGKLDEEKLMSAYFAEKEKENGAVTDDD